MKQLGRWRMVDELRPIGASPGAFLTNPIDARARAVAADRGAVAPAAPRRPARPAQHVHVHLPKVRGQVRTRDQATAAPAGFPISDGETFTVSDCGPAGFGLKRISAGDTDKDGMPSRGDAVFGQEDPPGAASLDALRRRMAPRQVNDRSLSSQQQGDQLRAMQQYLDEIHRPR